MVAKATLLLGGSVLFAVAAYLHPVWSAEPECPAGEAGCVCTEVLACDPGLECFLGQCEPPGKADYRHDYTVPNPVGLMR